MLLQYKCSRLIPSFHLSYSASHETSHSSACHQPDFPSIEHPKESRHTLVNAPNGERHCPLPLLHLQTMRTDDAMPHQHKLTQGRYVPASYIARTVMLHSSWLLLHAAKPRQEWKSMKPLLAQFDLLGYCFQGLEFLSPLLTSAGQHYQHHQELPGVSQLDQTKD